MRQKIKTIILSVLLFTAIDSYAQSHTFMPGWCRLAKSGKNQVQGESAKFQCKVCDKEKEKEKDAKIAEDKRRADITSANYNAKKAALKKAADLKKAEDLKNAHSGEVLINGNNFSVNSVKTTKGKTKIISKKENSNSKLFSAKKLDLEGFTTSFILNENGDTIRSSSKWYACVWNRIISKANIPTNVIIVLYQEQGKVMNSKTYNWTKRERFALINSKGEELLEEKRISYLNYVGNDFFVYTFVNDNDNILLDFNSDNLDYLSDFGCGRIVVLFDYKLNKKYYFNESACIRINSQSNLKDGVLLEFVLGRYGKDKFIVNSKREYIKINN